MIALYEKLRAAMFEEFRGVETGATKDYINWKVSGVRRTRQFANFYIQKENICILTLTPRTRQGAGETVSDDHMWTLNYRTYISTNADIEKTQGILLDSYKQIKQLV